jgi:hypothetical protein
MVRTPRFRVVYNDPKLGLENVDLVKASNDARPKLARILNPSSTDLDAVHRAGKIIHHHGAVRSCGRHLFLVSPETIVIERFTRVSDNDFHYVFSLIAPTFYNRSWTGEARLLRSNDRMSEYACHEGTISMRNILEAGRAHNVKDSVTVAPASANCCSHGPDQVDNWSQSERLNGRRKVVARAVGHSVRTNSQSRA